MNTHMLKGQLYCFSMVTNGSGSGLNSLKIIVFQHGHV